MLKSGECLLIIPLFNLLLLKIITCCSTIEVSGNLWKQSSIVFYKRITNDIFQNYSKIRKNIIAVFKNILQDCIHLILHSILQ
jgi:hypothetical protein